MFKKIINIIQNNLIFGCSHMGKRLTLAVSLFCLTLNVFCQKNTEQDLKDKFIAYQEDHFQEKIFVHTDKLNYLSGEICWFKIYTVDAWFNKLSSLSKVAYVEILDKDNHAVLQAKISLDKGLGDGSFYLPASVSSGNYKLRAYTNWMKNDGPDFFFEKKISIVNVQKTSPVIKKGKSLYEINFFPEGGNLVNGIESKIGFKVNDQFGKGVNFTGWLVNSKGDTITSFQPLKFGIGSFKLTPSTGDKYKALIKLANGEQCQKELPEIYSTGYVMHLEKSAANIVVTVQSNLNKAQEPVTLMLQTRNKIKVAFASTLQNNKAVFTISDTIPGEGISQLTLFDGNGHPLCERLHFTKPTKMLAISATADQANYNLRKKISLDISSSQNSKNVPANLSMAVYRIDSLNTIDPENINTYLLLSSDLKGTIESPAYYFDNSDAEAELAMDNLLLTQGWRRFKWNDVVAAKKNEPAFVPEINGPIVTGKVVSMKTNEPEAEVMAYLASPGTLTLFRTATSDDKGRIKFEVKNFYNDGEIVVQTNYRTDSTHKIIIDTVYYNNYSSKNLEPYQFNGEPDILQSTYVSSEVQNAYLSNKINLSEIRLTDTSFFYQQPDKTYLLDNYVRFTTVEEVLREYVREVMVRQHSGNYSLPVFDLGSMQVMREPPLLLLDGVPLFNFDKFMFFDALKIRKLEVVSRRYVLGNAVYFGVVNFTTYKGDLAGFEIDPKAVVMDYDGLQAKREFYTPVYDTEENLQSRLPDFRTLLQWVPNIETEVNKKNRLSFYSSDIPGRYAVVVQGLSRDGTAGSTVTYFDVTAP